MIHHQRGYQWIGFRELSTGNHRSLQHQKKGLSCTMIQSWEPLPLVLLLRVVRLNELEPRSCQILGPDMGNKLGNVRGYHWLHGNHMVFPGNQWGSCIFSIRPILGGHTVGEKGMAAWRKFTAGPHATTPCPFLRIGFSVVKWLLGQNVLLLILSHPAGSFPPSYHKISPEFGGTHKNLH